MGHLQNLVKRFQCDKIKGWTTYFKFVSIICAGYSLSAAIIIPQPVLRRIFTWLTAMFYITSFIFFKTAHLQKMAYAKHLMIILFVFNFIALLIEPIYAVALSLTTPSTKPSLYFVRDVDTTIIITNKIFMFDFFHVVYSFLLYRAANFVISARLAEVDPQLVIP